VAWSRDDTTEALARARAGDPAAAQAVFERLYADLRRIAGALFRSQRSGHTLEPTALVHEAYVKIASGHAAKAWQDRAHALAVGARAMRQVLANYARDRAAGKRGGGEARERVTISGIDGGGDRAVDAAALHEALDRLTALDERQGKIAEMRLLAGLTVEEVAELLGVSTRTVELDWQMAKRQLALWLAPKEGSKAP
jgi:RNA polymerase sigma-70 factor (ECF subfamily)